MAKVAIVKASELGDDWRAGTHVKVEVSVDDLEKLAELRRKRVEYGRRVDALDREEKEVLKKYLKEEA